MGGNKVVRVLPKKLDQNSEDGLHKFYFILRD